MSVHQTAHQTPGSPVRLPISSAVHREGANPSSVHKGPHSPTNSSPSAQLSVNCELRLELCGSLMVTHPGFAVHALEQRHEQIHSPQALQPPQPHGAPFKPPLSTSYFTDQSPHSRSAVQPAPPVSELALLHPHSSPYPPVNKHVLSGASSPQHPQPAVLNASSQLLASQTPKYNSTSPVVNEDSPLLSPSDSYFHAAWAEYLLNHGKASSLLSRPGSFKIHDVLQDHRNSPVQLSPSDPVHNLGHPTTSGNPLDSLDDARIAIGLVSLPFLLSRS